MTSTKRSNDTVTLADARLARLVQILKHFGGSVRGVGGAEWLGTGVGLKRQSPKELVLTKPFSLNRR